MVGLDIVLLGGSKNVLHDDLEEESVEMIWLHTDMMGCETF